MPGEEVIRTEAMTAMPSDLARVPTSMLLTPDLPALAKLVWMVARLVPSAGIGSLATTAGLSRLTVRKAMAQLRAAGWDPSRAEPQSPTVPVPAELLTNAKLGAHARVHYGLLHLTPGFSHPTGQFTYADLAALAHLSPNTVTKSIDQLVKAEWIKTERKNRRDRIHFELTYPGLDRGLTALARAERRLGKPKPYGEALMQEYLSLLIDSEEFADNTRPGFLVNPRTDERLEFDRFYPPKVAFEFNGPHHDGETDQVTAAASVAQQERDLIKLGICARRGITLVVVHPEDLSLTGMMSKVANLLPARDLTGYDLLIDFLDEESRNYRRRT